MSVERFVGIVAFALISGGFAGDVGRCYILHYNVEGAFVSVACIVFSGTRNSGCAVVEYYSIKSGDRLCSYSCSAQHIGDRLYTNVICCRSIPNLVTFSVCEAIACCVGNHFLVASDGTGDFGFRIIGDNHIKGAYVNVTCSVFSCTINYSSAVVEYNPVEGGDGICSFCGSAQHIGDRFYTYVVSSSGVPNLITFSVCEAIFCGVGNHYLVAGDGTGDFGFSIVEDKHMEGAGGFVAGSILGSPRNGGSTHIKLLSVEGGSITVNDGGDTAERVGEGGDSYIIGGCGVPICSAVSVEVFVRIVVFMLVCCYSTSDLGGGLVSYYYLELAGSFVAGSILGSPRNGSSAHIELLSVEGGGITVNGSSSTAECVGE